LNQNDQVVGGIVVNGKSYAFLWDAGTMTLFGKAGALTNYATDVNDNVTANVVGSFTNSGINTHGFLWRPGVMFDLGALPGSDESIARAVNNSGRIVGKSASKAVIWQNGEIRDLNAFLNAAPTVMTDAIDIDRAGRVLALGQDGYNYLLTPLY
jgi:probable HAF family extracellular repeat protein